MARDPALETVRGLACLLLVSYHVIGSDAGAGMHVADDSAYRYATTSLLFIRMPLFTFLSGAVYAMRPVRPDRAGPFLRGKVRRLLIPLAVASTLFAAFLEVIPGVHGAPAPGELWRIYLWPFAHYWYLQSLFLIFLAMAALDGLRLMDRLPGWLTVSAAAVALYVAAPAAPEFFGLRAALLLLPFFLAGVGFTRFRRLFETPAVRWTILAAAALSLIVSQAAILRDMPAATADNGALGLVVGLTVCTALVLLGLRSGPLMWVGAYSYAIYLYHVFGTAAARMALVKVTSFSPLIFAGGLAAGILLPVAGSLVAARVPALALLFLGQAPQPGRHGVRAADRAADPSAGLRP